MRELGDRRAGSFLKKFYGWYLRRGRFPRQLRRELVEAGTLKDVERLLLAAAPGAEELLAQLEAGIPRPAETALELPLALSGGG